MDIFSKEKFEKGNLSTIFIYSRVGIKILLMSWNRYLKAQDLQ